jgi:hypothetical protein
MLFEKKVIEDIYLSNFLIFKSKDELKEFLDKKYPDQDLDIDLLIKDDMIEFIENVTSDEVITLMNMGYKVYRKDMI